MGILWDSIEILRYGACFLLYAMVYREHGDSLPLCDKSERFILFFIVIYQRVSLGILWDSAPCYRPTGQQGVGMGHGARGGTYIHTLPEISKTNMC